MGKVYEQANHSRENQDGNKHMKKCANSVVLREIQAKIKIRGLPWWRSG